jgi:ribosomal protein S18 acetylase RimI-like enzyme
LKTPTIRPAKESDAPELARLMAQLGYPAPIDVVRARLERLLHSSGNLLLIAEGSGGELVGWIHGFLCQLLEADYRVEIGGLVVDERFRRNGIGCQLVKAIEDWAAEHGRVELSVRCREERTGAHGFYKALQFQHTKTQFVFRKQPGQTRP